MAEETYFDKISAQIKTGNEPFRWYRNRIAELGTPSVPELLRTGDLNNLGIIFSYTAKLSPQPHDAVALGFITFKYEPPNSCT